MFTYTYTYTIKIIIISHLLFFMGSPNYSASNASSASNTMKSSLRNPCPHPMDLLWLDFGSVYFQVKWFGLVFFISFQFPAAFPGHSFTSYGDWKAAGGRREPEKILCLHMSLNWILLCLSAPAAAGNGIVGWFELEEIKQTLRAEPN